MEGVEGVEGDWLRIEGKFYYTTAATKRLSKIADAQLLQGEVYRGDTRQSRYYFIDSNNTPIPLGKTEKEAVRTLTQWGDFKWRAFHG